MSARPTSRRSRTQNPAPPLLRYCSHKRPRPALASRRPLLQSPWKAERNGWLPIGKPSGKRKEFGVSPDPSCPITPSGLQQLSGSGVACKLEQANRSKSYFSTITLLCSISDKIELELFYTEQKGGQTSVESR